jgi:Recombination enhancement, RecA-dependent nuclease
MIWHAGQKRATKLEREYTARVRELPCLCCEQFGISRTAALHHIKDGGHRMGERFVIPLCSGHHQADFARGEDYGARLSVHRDHRKFVEVFGTERSLWEKVQRKLNLPITGWPESKLVPRRIVQESTDDWA